MEGISDICIAGMDEKRPPRIRKEPYIDLHFRLNHQAPKDWCEGFNELLTKHDYAPRIEASEGLYIDTWVRSPDEIVGVLQLLKETVVRSTAQYIERVQERNQERNDVNDELEKGEGPQGQLNRIVAALDYGV